MKNNFIRISIYISPNIETSLQNGLISEEELFKILKSFIKLADFLRLSCFVFLPSTLKSWQYSPKIRILLEKIESDSQSNIMFLSKKINCDQIKEVEEISITETNIINSLIINKLPFLFTTLEEKGYLKRNCNSCEKSDTLCYSTKKINVENISLIDTEFKRILEDYCKISLDKWYINIKKIDEIKIKQFLIIYAKLKNVSEDLINKIEIIKITDDFIQDLKKELPREIENILSSMLRAILYPSSQEKGRTENSIDYHRNTIFNVDGFKIFRLDVVPWSESGSKKSGLKRILFAEDKDNKKIFFYYDFDHADLSEKMIKSKLRDIS